MMKNMKPEDMQRMQEMSAQMMAGGGGAARSSGASGPTAGGDGAAPDMSAMLRNPEMMQTALSSMKNMSEDDLVNMFKMSQPGMSDEAARTCAP